MIPFPPTFNNFSNTFISKSKEACFPKRSFPITKSYLLLQSWYSYNFIAAIVIPPFISFLMQFILIFSIISGSLSVAAMDLALVNFFNAIDAIPVPEDNYKIYFPSKMFLFRTICLANTIGVSQSLSLSKPPGNISISPIFSFILLS